MNEKICFFGTGYIGRRVLELWKRYEVFPDYFCDNNKELWGTVFEGIKIISPAELLRLHDFKVYITCKAVDEIRNQLTSLGVSNDIIIDGSFIDLSIFLLSIFQKKQNNYVINHYINEKQCIFDFTYGTFLGGVQTWSFSAAYKLSQLGFNGIYLMNTEVPHEDVGGVFNTVAIDSGRVNSDIEYVELYLKYILECDAKYVICSFPREIFYAAIVAKSLYKHNLVIIAVIHNDEQIYYDNYIRFEHVINKYLVISERMMNRMLIAGIANDLIFKLQWKISIDNKKNHKYSAKNEAIRIGYAGRITIIQKRIDLLILLAEKLKNAGINYMLEIVGDGESKDYLLEEIQNRNLSDNIIFDGLIKHDKINKFWEKQDIYCSCSDYEGHSISQYEALVNGVVPVVTDVSGVRDDIEDGINGFIFPVGDIDLAVERISYLFEHRKLLKLMGDRSIKKIKERNETIDELLIWKNIMEV